MGSEGAGELRREGKLKEVEGFPRYWYYHEG